MITHPDNKCPKCGGDWLKSDSGTICKSCGEALVCEECNITQVTSFYYDDGAWLDIHMYQYRLCKSCSIDYGFDQLSHTR
jgi:hypothetical protein